MEKITKKKTKIVWRGFFIRIFVLVAIMISSYAVFFLYKISSLEKNLNIHRQQNNKSTLAEATKNLVLQKNVPLKGEDRGRINILLLGIGGEGHSGRYLTDTIILASINPKTNQSSLLSIPRDLYVNIPNTSISTKINAAYAYETLNNKKDTGAALSSLKKIVSKITGQPIDYYLVVDFDGFKKVIDHIGGVDVQVEDDILDTRYPGPNFSYETFKIDKGSHHLNGEMALKYARVRHTKGGDFGRAARQQQIIAATKKKAFSIETMTNPITINNLINDLGDHVKTDIRLADIPSFMHLAKNINVYQTTNKVLDAWSPDSLLASSHAPLGGVMAYILLPKAKNYRPIQNLAKDIFNLELIEKKSEERTKEAAKIGLVVPENQNSLSVAEALSKININANTITDKNYKKSIACNNETKIFSTSTFPKIFTLDFLTDTLDKEVEKTTSSSPDFDIILCLSAEDISFFESLGSEKPDDTQNNQNESVLDGSGNIRFNQTN